MIPKVKVYHKGRIKLMLLPPRGTKGYRITEMNGRYVTWAFEGTASQVQYQARKRHDVYIVKQHFNQLREKIRSQ